MRFFEFAEMGNCENPQMRMSEYAHLRVVRGVLPVALS